MADKKELAKKDKPTKLSKEQLRKLKGGAGGMGRTYSCITGCSKCNRGITNKTDICEAL